MFKFTLDDSHLISYSSVKIEDLKMNTMTELANGGSYTFSNDINFSGNRFILHFAGSGVGEEEFEDIKDYSAFMVNNKLYVQGDLSSYSSLNGEILDMQGRSVYSMEVETTSMASEYLIPSLADGVYLFVLKSKKQKAKSKNQTIGVDKVVVQN